MNLYCMKLKAKGSTLVEFAILLPIFIMLVMGTIEMGWALFIQNTLVDAARHGSRIAVTQSVNDSFIRTEIENYIQNARIPGTPTIDINPAPASSQTRGTLITVTVDIPYNSASILPTPLFLNDRILSAHSTMSKEF